MKIRSFIMACGTLALLLGSASIPAFAANAIEDLRAFVRDTKTVRAEFTQTTTSKKDPNGQTVQGSLLLSRPGKFRWSTEKPFPQLIVGDGERVWSFDPDLEQVIVRTHAQVLGGTPAALLAGSEDFERAFELKALPNAQGKQWVLAKPRNKEEDAGFTHIKLGFSQGKLSTMELDDAFGQKIVTHYRYVEYNPELSPDLFRFTPPPGADVIGEVSVKPGKKE